MLSRPHRLGKTTEIRQAFAAGRSFFTPYFLFKHASRADGRRRFAVIVSTKFSKKAVARNKIKRQIRETIRINLKRLKPGDYIITARLSLAKQNPKAVPAVLLQALERSHLVD